jgi:hypothetical protein
MDKRAFPFFNPAIYLISFTLKLFLTRDRCMDDRVDGRIALP